MLSIYKRNSYINFIINSIFIIFLFICFLYPNSSAYAITNNWVEVAKTNEGRQFWDKDSLLNKDKGIIQITTKYIQLDPNTSKIIDEDLYVMMIDCIGNKYKDISTNGRKNKRSEWEHSNGDILINEVISDGCKMP